ncbi:MAG: hypothetical protein M1819_004184 [Sarea resinae]|nr:MAG: hypothetical protein M1819_004184 [Sarea resinae]
MDIPPSFVQKKQKILQQLARPDADYQDLSPKGSVDEGIRELIDQINSTDGIVTTSSCAGRISVFLEGRRKEDPGSEPSQRLAGAGGKGGGGRWLYVSHDRLLSPESVQLEELFGLSRGLHPDRGACDEERYAHFKFEPMILHILTASHHHAQHVLSAALQAGFRESGAINLIPNSSDQNAAVTPIVAVRSSGLALDSIVGRLAPNAEDVEEIESLVGEGYLQTLVNIANGRFAVNEQRIQRFTDLLGSSTDEKDASAWEDANVRKKRKRAEGLRRREEIMRSRQQKALELGQHDDSFPINLNS